MIVNYCTIKLTKRIKAQARNPKNICICNPFSDKNVQTYLSSQSDKSTISQAYRHCTGENKPCCGNCLQELRGMVRDHTAAMTVRALEHEFQDRARAETPATEKSPESV